MQRSMPALAIAASRVRRTAKQHRQCDDCTVPRRCRSTLRLYSWPAGRRPALCRPAAGWPLRFIEHQGQGRPPPPRSIWLALDDDCFACALQQRAAHMCSAPCSKPASVYWACSHLRVVRLACSWSASLLEPAVRARSFGLEGSVSVLGSTWISRAL